MGEFSLTHILLFALIALLFFGPKRLPSLGQSLGKAIRNFKESMNEIEVDVKPVQSQPTQQPKAEELAHQQTEQPAQPTSQPAQQTEDKKNHA